MKYTVEMSSRFKKDYKVVQKRGKDVKLLKDVIDQLIEGQDLPERYCDHALIGNYANCRECHIQPDWLLIYRIWEDRLILTLTRTGTHSELFKK